MYKREVHEYAQQVKRNVEKNIQKNANKHAKFWDYPACVSICFGRKLGFYVKGYSHSPNGTIWHSILEREMKKVGIIGKATRICKNILGKCAEQHSGNNYMKEAHETNLANLNFSPTVRPRTGQVIKPCKNCKNIFPNL
ncbi:MAG: hypothetical protein HDS74_02880 [Bacteroidales bacterium]|nr:hypothetical protein [Bacteroidales bacterium]